MRTNGTLVETTNGDMTGRRFGPACVSRWLALLLLALPAMLPGAVSGATFPIATEGAVFSGAYDGANYLIGIENYQTPRPTIAAQMFSPNGAKIGPLIKPGRTGIATTVAFDGTRYLMIWEDDNYGTVDGIYQVWGQFVSKAGKASGSPFPISDKKIWFDGIKVMAFGGGSYLVTYTRLIDPANVDNSQNRYIGGRIVYPDGTMGSRFCISTGYGDQSDVAFDGTNFFVVWTEDSQNKEIRGRFVSPDGVCGAELSVNASGAYSDNPKSVAFDGTNYLVVWNDEIGGARKWDVFGQLVSPSGALVGSVIPITTEPGQQMVTSVACDGINYMAVWVDMQDGANWDVYGQVIGRDGTLVGVRKVIATWAGNQIAFVGFANGNYLALVSSGVIMGEDGLEKVDAAYGVFVKPPARRTIGVSGNLSFGNVYTGQTATATLTITNRGNRALTVSSIKYPEGFSGDWSGILAVGEATNVTVTFSPETAQAYGGAVTVNSDMTGGGNTMTASGAGLSDELPGQICFAASSYSAEEGTKINVEVSRMCGSSGTVSVSYTTNPKTALAWQDYIPKSGTLTWTNGQIAPKVIKIPIQADTLTEGNEVFQVVLNNPVGTILTAPARTLITILGK